MDRYVKVVLTVIAVALSIDAIERIAKPAQAAVGITKVVICDPDYPNACAHIYESASLANQLGTVKPQTGFRVFSQ